MPNTYKKIASVTVGSGGASTIEFNSIPQTYTDLKVVVSARSTNADIDDHLFVKPNNSATNMTQQWIRGNGSASSTGTSVRFAIPGATATASTFSNTEFYFPNYTSAVNKDFQGTTVQETNGTEAYIYLCSFLWSDTSAITSLVLDLSNGNFAEYSSATLYGVSNNVLSNQSSPYATGGTITTNGQYYIHTFTSSGTFTPSQTLSCEYLVVAGGGGGGREQSGGGGGAGGMRTGTLSVTSGTKTVTVGAGGSGGVISQKQGSNGSNSVFDSITSTGGGGGGGYSGTGNTTGSAGGSGGGGAGGNGSFAGGAGTAGQGFAGGLGRSDGATYRTSGGGGGASAVGVDGATGAKSGNGGAGLASSISGISATYAGGGGGGTYALADIGLGGAGGGGNGGYLNVPGNAGTVNTGGGAGGAGDSNDGAAGGSGIVIIRYPR